MVCLNNSWDLILKDEFQSDYYLKLREFLKKETSLEIVDRGNWFYAVCRCTKVLPGFGAGQNTDVSKGPIAFRADFDALPMPDDIDAPWKSQFENVGHKCGHDGHAAALCGAALLAEGRLFNRNIFFLFQPAEETGKGAQECLELFLLESVDEIYGAHNLPGFPFGQVLTRPGTFACASRGVTLHFGGNPTHAAYPENGISPAAAVGHYARLSALLWVRRPLALPLQPPRYG